MRNMGEVGLTVAPLIDAKARRSCSTVHDPFRPLSRSRTPCRRSKHCQWKRLQSCY
jgi:hypothetical protein